MKVGIIGVGMVGSALQHGFSRIGHDIVIYDPKLPDTVFENVLSSEIVFICVPTPSNQDGTCDTSIVESVVKKLADANYKGLATIKSTVEPGTTQKLSKKYPKLRLAFCPEFLRERAMYVDFVENHDVCIIGTSNEKDAELLSNVHGSLPKHFAYVNVTEAEFAKYFLNVFNALRVVYANQFYDLCKASGADYRKVKEAIVKHRNIQDVYLDCNENFRGFGGACLPKDTMALAQFAKKMIGDGKNMSIFEGIVEINKKYKTTIL
jgi:UDPglucose 6-dehydrogenase